MGSKRLISACGFLAMLGFLLPCIALGQTFRVNSRSAILIDMTDGKVLFEQNADTQIAPASITKVISLYLVFDAIREGRVHLWDIVTVSANAACTGGSRMGLRTGDRVALEELIKGMAVVSGNDACVAVAEYLAGSVDAFVRRMNAKARELGMASTVFMTPNGLPAKGQVTTARDIAKLSISYLRHYPESLAIHSMQSYTYNRGTHRNANRLLGRCPGVDGLKTGFVCASGYNLSATAKRGDTRLLAVVLGAPSPGVRAVETEKLLEAGFRAVQSDSPVIRMVEAPARAVRESHPDTEDAPCPVGKGGKKVRTAKRAGKGAVAASCVIRDAAPKGRAKSVKGAVAASNTAAKESGSKSRPAASSKTASIKKAEDGKKTSSDAPVVASAKAKKPAKIEPVQAATPAKKNVETPKTQRRAQDTRKKQG